VFLISKGRHIFGIDDGSGVVTCIMWVDKQKDPQNEINKLFEYSIRPGTQLSVLGKLEYYNNEI